MPVRLTTSLRPPEQITRAHVIAAVGRELCGNPNEPKPEALSSRYSLFLPASTKISVNADQT